MKILSLDLGSVVGVCDNGKNFSWDYSKSPSREWRLSRFHDELLRYLTHRSEVSPDGCIVYERPFCRGLAATRSLWGMAGIIDALGCANGYPVLDVVPTKVKKWSTGNGFASKKEMIAQAVERGFTGGNEHEADAFLLYHYTLFNAHVTSGEVIG